MDWESRAETIETRWESEDGSRWRIEFQALPMDGRLEAVGLRLRSWPRDRHAEPRRLLANHLREMKLAELFMLACRARAAELRGDAELMRDTDIFIDSGRLEDWEDGREPEVRMWAGAELAAEAGRREGEAAAAAARGREVGRGGFSRDVLEEAAAAYLAAWRDRRPPQKAVADALGIPRAQAGNMVRRCRVLGLLPPTRRGVPRGWSGPQSEEG